MREKSRILFLVLVMSAISACIAASAFIILYEAAFEQHRLRLVEIVHNQASIIESVSAYDKEHFEKSHDLADELDNAFDATMIQIKDAHEHFEGFGKTGEFVLAKKEGDQIVFLLSQRHQRVENLKPIPFLSHFAEPMRRALAGESGTMVGLDYRGAKVLAAYEPVKVYGLGIVAKIDLAEVRLPFIRAGLLSAVFGLMLIFIGAILVRRIGNPLINKLEKYAQELEEEIAEHKRSESALIEREALLNEVGNIAKIGGWEMDLVTRKAKWTKGTFDVVEIDYDQDAPGPDEHISYYLPEFQSVVAEAMRKLIEEDIPLDFEAKAKTAKGNIIWARAIGRSVRRDGKCVRVVGTLQDITKRKQAEEALRESQERFRAIAETAKDSIFTKDLERRYTYVNRAMTELFDCRPEDLIGKTPEEIFDPKSAKIVAEVDAVALKGGTADQVRSLPIGGREYVFHTVQVPLRKIDDEISGICGIVRDITDQKLAEEKLRESEELLGAMARNYPNSYISIIEKDLTVGFTAGQEFRKLNLDPNSFIGLSLDQVFGSDAPFVKEQYLKAFAGEEVSFELFVNNQHQLYKAVPLMNERGEIVQILAVVENITDRKRAEKALKESEDALKSIFLAAPVGIGLVIDRVILRVNERICEMIGYSQEELIGQNARILYPTTEDYEYVGREKYRQIAEKGIGTVETRWQRKDGAIIDVLLSSSPINPDDHAVGVTFSALDITDRKRAEEALRTERDMLQGLMDGLATTGIGVDVVGVDYTILHQNKLLMDTFGDLSGKLCYKNYIGLDTPCINCPMAETIKSRKVERVEMSGSDGRLYEVLSAPLPSPDGTIDKAIEVVIDITERKLAEEALVASERNYHEIFDASDDAIVVHDLETGEIVNVNKRMCEMFGYTLEEALRLETVDLSQGDPPFSKDDAAKWIQRAAEEGPQRFEWLCRKSNGELFWAEVLLQRATIGGVERIMATDRDITDRKQAEEKLADSYRFLQTVLDNMPSPVFYKDAKGVYLGCNLEFEKFLGKSRSEIVGKTVYEVAPKKLAETYQSADERLLEDRGIQQYDSKVKHADGTDRDVLFHKAVFDGPDGEPAGIVGVMIDMTERKMAEDERVKLEEQLRQSQKMESIGRLAGGVAHDFNNLLTGINGYTEIIIGGLDPYDPMRKDMEEILRAGERAAALTNQLLAFSRKQVISPKVIQPNEILDRSQKMLRRIIGEDVDLLFVPDKDLGRIKADPAQIDQVLVNLAVNARDAMRDGGKLTIETQNVALDEGFCKIHIGLKPGDYVMLAVTDTGHGMDKQTRENIFEPFFSTKPKDQGTGLGLATVYGIVKQNNGFISVYSEVDVGTTFKVYFPRELEEADSLVEDKLTDLPMGKETILLVEDEEMVRRLAQRILERQGYKVIGVADGGKAYLACTKHKDTIDLLLTDVIMPTMNGRELHEKLLELKPGLKVLFMSGYTENVIAHHGVLGEDTQFIQKPFTIDVLAHKVREVLDS